VGIKSAVGDSRFWEDLAGSMATGTRGVDFITIDGGEGGTGAGPLVFTDHVALPFKVGFSRVQKIFTAHGLHERVVFIGSGKLGFPEATVFAFALGHRLHSGAAVSYESLPDGGRHSASVAGARSGSDTQGGAAGQLHHHAAERRPHTEPRLRRAASRTHHGRSLADEMASDR
jgi:hypothetical protein